MEHSTEPKMDPFSKMIDLAVFHLRKEATDTMLPREIEKLGFRIAAFDDTEMMVTIKHPSASVMQKFLKVTRESDTANTVPELCSSSSLGRKIDESTNPQALSSMAGDESHTISWMNEKASQEEMLTYPRGYDEEKDDNGRSESGLREEERISSSMRLRCIDQKDPERDIQDLSNSKEHLKIRKRELERNSNDLKTLISDEAGQNLPLSDEEQTEHEDMDCNSEQQQQISHYSDLRSNEISSFNTPSDSQPGCLDLLPGVLYSDQERSPFDQKFQKTPALTIQHQLKDNDGSIVRGKEKSHSFEKQVCDQTSTSLPLCEEKKAMEEHHVKNKENDQASNSFHSNNTERNGQTAVNGQFYFQKDSSRKATFEGRNEEDAANTESCVSNQNVKMDENQYRPFRKGLYPNVGGIVTSGNPTGIPPSVSSQNILMSGVKNEIYEVMEFSEPVFRKVCLEFKDSMGTYSCRTSKTGEKVITVHVKKSHDFERLMTYVQWLQSTAAFQSPPSHATETHIGNSSVQHRSGVSSDTHASYDSFEKKFLGLTFEVEQVDITSLSHDVVVCPGDKFLNLNIGISRAMSDHAGADLRAACDKFISYERLLGKTDILITPAGNLPAVKVFHVVAPFTNAEDLRKSLLTCLVLADIRRFKSIAFPFINTLTPKGEEYFKTLVLSVIFFDTYCMYNKRFQNLKKVTFVDKDSLLVQHFVKFLKKNWGYLSTSCNSPNYDEQNSRNEFMKEIQTIYKICSKTTSTSFDGCFSEVADGARALDDDCPICCSYPANDFLSCCNQRICQLCKRRLQRCPYCQKIFHVMRGNQPPGKMTIEVSRCELPGHRGYGSYIITYYFQGGYQKVGHPNPGIEYRRARRTAYLPQTEEARLLISRLILAFTRCLTFTVGTSLTTLKENSIVWNGIHHKTTLEADRPSYGYPDPEYFVRLDIELTDRGVTLDTMTSEEQAQIKGCWKNLKGKGIACINSL